jgi:signal transduction histidine kinase
LVTVMAAPLPPLPAAVEVAAYRIVTEAVANAVRHARPTACNVSLAANDGELHITVADDGQGIAADATAGVGLASMSERASEVGGRLTIDSSRVGTIVTAVLPIPLESS